MRSFITMLMTFLLSVTFADEVVLSPQTRKANRPFVERSPAVRFEGTARPEGVTPPEGDLIWGRLILGEKSYTVCILTEDDKEKLYIDRDGDMNLKEETPLETEKNSQGYGFFSIDGLSGEFKVGEESLSVKMRIVFSPKLTRLRGWLPVCTAFLGNIEVEGRTLTVVWVPGNRPILQSPIPSMSRAPLTSIHVGRNEISLKEEITLKGNRPVVNYTSTVDEDSLPADADESLSAALVYSDRSYRVCLPSKGKLFLPKKANYLYFSFIKEEKDDKFELLVFRRGFKDEEEMKIPSPEPLKLALNIEQEPGIIWITPELTDASGNALHILKNGERLKPPVLRVKDTEGKEVVKHTYKCG